MRWKLIILSSLIISFVSASAWLALAKLVIHAAIFPTGIGFYLQAFILVLITTVLGVYIYRHTSQRRKLQAILTSLLTLVLIFAFLFVFSIVIDLIAQNSA